MIYSDRQRGGKDLNTWLTVLTSAAVAVLVSGAITLLGQYLERRARRDELLFTKALETAIRKNEVTIRALEVSGGHATLQDEVISAETYLRWLKELLNTGKLPPDAGRFKEEEQREPVVLVLGTRVRSVRRSADLEKQVCGSQESLCFARNYLGCTNFEI
jgi:hypothetical protein